MEQNWAGNIAYQAREVARPRSVDALRQLVADRDRVRALGSRHSFNDLADGQGTLVSLEEMPDEIVVTGQQVSVPAGVRYGVLAEFLAERGLALPNMASLPHISVAGAIATATHGSGDGNGCLSTAVAGLELVTSSGGLRTLWRGDPEFAGSVVALGALGVITRVTLDVRPAFEVRQQVYPSVPWSTVAGELAEVFASGYSVSVFTDWVGPAQVWVKSLDPVALPYTPADGPVHMLPGESVAAVTEQGGVPGPWLDRLPHFRLGHKPSAGAELQSEYLLPRDSAPEALARLREMGPRIAPLLQITELRTVAADTLWLSPAGGRDVLGIHFTWKLDVPGVTGLLPDIEAVLLPLGARPHWGKLFHTSEISTLYPRWTDFLELRAHHDPKGKFTNPFLDRLT
ncbi:D-arabinono-1,4-lactone oxidase [Actinophytocola algeriensis]|uniref:Xylitol oxidase n=1 Tax=Actinophytocola algeriensis TaxID=1768010 RepID=A0A7W7QA31_9PSEU|nr:D-arabinono-1,4-lactone oxidase [Actinophytocola algeriensis]MBB4909790.1 xylitol oxidase [Actinophytocola algeriensis]MBE1475780.1 xylitol oxidase [Actinophytocola algeriensis]